MEGQAATTLGAKEIGCVNLSLDRPLVCEAYRENRDLGSFILVDALQAASMFAALTACERNARKTGPVGSGRAKSPVGDPLEPARPQKSEAMPLFSQSP
jgi:sulfate adenylyltransferase subunit 1 (EFTu-like GTPase family)